MPAIQQSVSIRFERSERSSKALAQYEDHGPGGHDVLGNPPLATRVEGGGPLSQTPAECTVSFDRRPVPVRQLLISSPASRPI